MAQDTRHGEDARHGEDPIIVRRPICYSKVYTNWYMGRDSGKVKPGLKEGQAGGFIPFTRAEFWTDFGA